MALQVSLLHMFKVAGPAQRHHRYLNGIAYQPGKLKVVTFHGAIPVYRVDDDLTCSQLFYPAHMAYRVNTCFFISTMGINHVFSEQGLFNINRYHYALAPEMFSHMCYYC